MTPMFSTKNKWKKATAQYLFVGGLLIGAMSVMLGPDALIYGGYQFLVAFLMVVLAFILGK